MGVNYWAGRDAPEDLRAQGVYRDEQSRRGTTGHRPGDDSARGVWQPPLIGLRGSYRSRYRSPYRSICEIDVNTYAAGLPDSANDHTRSKRSSGHLLGTSFLSGFMFLAISGIR